MGLSNEQVKKLVQDQPNKKKINRGVKHQQRLAFHTDTILDKLDLSPYYQSFINWVGSERPELIANDKFVRFKHLCTAPISTIELTESIFTNLFRIFSAQDSFFDFQFTSEELGNDYLEFRDQVFWQTKGYQSMINAIDSVWIADLPQEQSGFRPEPVNLLINISQVIDIKNDDSNNCQHLIFHSGEFLYVYDNEQFLVYGYKDKQISEAPMTIIPHDLGYCPARMFWSERLETKNLINKKAPLSNVLSSLDWLLFHQTSKKYMDISNAYPITITYENSDDSDNIERTEENDRGKDEKKPSGADLMGAGSHIQVPPPDGDGPDMMVNPVKVVSPDVATLEYHVGEEDRLEDNIFKSVVGVDGEPNTDQAKNEKQVQAAFESRIDVLMSVKKNYEIIQTFAEKTIAGLRYGREFLGLTIDYGTKFFLKTVSDLYEDFSTIKKTGGNEAVLDSINDSILKTKFRNDNRGFERATIISDLDPLPNREFSEVKEMFDKQAISKDVFIVKINFLNFIKKFEREQMPLNEFAKLIDYNQKINLINEAFKRYATEMGVTKINNDGL